MKLTYEQIKKIAVGAVRIEQNKNGIQFYKCTQKQIDAWVKLQNDMFGRAVSTTGIRLDFHTNSDRVCFNVTGGKFEVLINGTLFGQYLTKVSDRQTISIDMPEGKNRITLVFPSHFFGTLCSVEIDDDSIVETHKFDKKLLFIGDSITQGWNSKYDNMSFAYRVSDFFNAESVINGIGGAFYDPTTFDSIDFDPDVVMVAYGCNDYDRYSSIDVLKEKSTGFLKLIKKEYFDKRIYAILPIWRADCDEPKSMGVFSDCRKALREVFESLSIEYIDAYNFVPHNLDFYADIVHPNDLGFSVYAQNLIFELQKRGN